jgi:hypothetical protein
MDAINIADLRDPNDPQGRTYRQVNAATTHAITVGSLVETENGERLFVKKHTRDCDQTPMYSLGLLSDDEGPYSKWIHGFPEYLLTVVVPQSGS